MAYSDKGTGNGAHDLAANNVYRLNGSMTSAANAGKESTFTAPLSDADRAAFN